MMIEATIKRTQQPGLAGFVATPSRTAPTASL